MNDERYAISLSYKELILLRSLILNRLLGKHSMVEDIEFHSQLYNHLDDRIKFIIHSRNENE